MSNNVAPVVKCSEFVKRQTKDSGYSHFEGSWEQLEEITEAHLKYSNIFVRPGYKDGVIIVDLPGWLFKSAIVNIDDKTKLNVSYISRREGESPCVKISAKEKKQKARYASVVLYSADVLSEDNERSSEADWEIVAIKARMDKEEEPMEPYTMARNYLHLSGGTKGDFTAEQFANSIVYWNNHCIINNVSNINLSMSKLFYLVSKNQIFIGNIVSILTTINLFVCLIAWGYGASQRIISIF